MPAKPADERGATPMTVRPLSPNPRLARGVHNTESAAYVEASAARAIAMTRTDLSTCRLSDCIAGVSMPPIDAFVCSRDAPLAGARIPMSVCQMNEVIEIADAM